MSRCFAVAVLLFACSIEQIYRVGAVTKPFCQDTLGVEKHPVLSTDLVFHDAWGPKLIGTTDGQKYDPSQIDWSSVIEACRVILKYENRIANWAIRASFHDSGANTVTQAVGTGSTSDAVPITVGGADASLFLSAESLAAANTQHSFAAFTAATLRKLVGFYDISYSDGIAVLAAVAVEVASAGKFDVYSFMPAIDKANPHTSIVDFIVGKLDSNVSDDYSVMPSPLATPQDAIDYFKPRFNQGIKDGLCLLGSHTLISTTGCTKSDNPGYNPHKERMFTWEADHSYYPSLLQATPPLMTVAANPATVGPLMQPALQINQTQIDMCKFSSDAFKYEASRQNVRSYPTPLGNIADLLPTWNWLNATSPNKSDYHEVRRSCDDQGNCFEGWPYTFNDGLLGQMSNNSTAAGDFLVIKDTIKTMAHNPEKWNACYRNAYNRMVSMGATYSPMTKDKTTLGQKISTGSGKGLTITGWECPSGWVAGDANSTDANQLCQKSCKKACPDKYMKAPLYCRCSTAPWGSVAYNTLYPSAVIQDAAGNYVDGLVDVLDAANPFGAGLPTDPFAGGVVADNISHAFADEAILTDAQLYPGLDENAADNVPSNGGHQHGGGKCHKHGCGHPFRVEVDRIYGNGNEVDVTVSKGHPGHHTEHRHDELLQALPSTQDNVNGQTYRGHTYVPGKVPASLALNDYSQSFTDFQQPNCGYALDYDDLAAKGYNTKALIQDS